MSKAIVMTDSTCGLPAEILAEKNILVVPCRVNVGQAVYREGVDLTAEELYRQMFASQETPTTSMPAGEDYQAAFQQVVDQGYDQVLGVFVGSAYSGTFNGARLAAQEYPLEVALVDSGTTSLALGMLAMHGADLLAQGVPLEEAAAECRRLAEGAEAHALLDTLEYVRRGGRIGRVGELIATMLHIKPILRLARNAADVVARTRSQKRGIAKLRKTVEEAAPLLGLAMIHTSDSTRELAAQLAEELGHFVVEGGPVLVAPAGAALAVHTGPGGVAATFLRKL